MLIVISVAVLADERLHQLMGDVRARRGHNLLVGPLFFPLKRVEAVVLVSDVEAVFKEVKYSL